MRSFIAYIVLFSIMLPTLSPWGTVAYFHVNRAYIAKVFCENRNRPALLCNGKCYLAKLLKKQQEKKDKETTERVENTPVAQLFYLPVFSFTFGEKLFVRKKPVYFAYTLSRYLAFLGQIIRPPRFSGAFSGF
ncbi:hypothetical protein FDK13_33580 [Dyadobacter frigoris]|uniref:Uncharacterized protein n=2 Tax=Dyadobacter frigoris TaxID=2576211 RepID=A0A4U6CNM5_9BACT|nr:hypothetical protein FDK13_33580 [Dyadobacter frigoris]